MDSQDPPEAPQAEAEPTAEVRLADKRRRAVAKRARVDVKQRRSQEKRARRRARPRRHSDVPLAPVAVQPGRPRPRSPTLTEIARHLNAEKAHQHEPITDVYERYLWPWRDDPITLLEIGIKRGSSLRLWHDYFPRARIFALDIRDCSGKVPRSERIETFVGDQSDAEVLAGVVAASGPLDLVIDDGSHYAADQRASLLALWPALEPGGLYAIEDIATSYRSRGTSYHQPGSTVEMLKDLVEDVHERHHRRGALLGSVGAVHFERNVALLRRAEEPESRAHTSVDG